jgi:hypothetical protein
MSASISDSGILVGVDGSPACNYAVACSTRYSGCRQGLEQDQSGRRDSPLPHPYAPVEFVVRRSTKAIWPPSVRAPALYATAPRASRTG